MLGREHHVSAAVKCVGARRENADFLFAPVDFEIDFCAFTAANPIALKEFNSFRPIQCVQFIKQSLRKSGDAQHPLPHGPPHTGKPPISLFPSTTSSFANTVPSSAHQFTGTSAT